MSMSEEWMKTSFFPLLPLDIDDSTAGTDSVEACSSSPKPSITPSSVKLSSKSPKKVSVATKTDISSLPTGQHGMATSIIADPSAADVTSPAPISPLVSVPSQAEPPVAGSAGPELPSAELVMFNKIISSGCIIKSQQRGDPDLCHSELCSELAAFLQHKPGAFLMRYGRYLDHQDLQYFDGIPQSSDFEVTFRLGRLRQALNQSSKSRSKRIRNRRYECLRHLMEESSYFSEDEMRQRNPLLYDFYIGQYLSKEEKQRDVKDYTDMTLSFMILNQMDQDETAELLRRQRKCEVEQISSSNTAGYDVPKSSKNHSKSLKAMELSSDPVIADREKCMLRQEFLAAMQTHFLEGKDKDFDYSRVDNDEQYDSLDMRERDEQDSYFDEEEPSWWDEEECTDSNMEVT